MTVFGWSLVEIQSEYVLWCPLIYQRLKNLFSLLIWWTRIKRDLSGLRIASNGHFLVRERSVFSMPPTTRHLSMQESGSHLKWYHFIKNRCFSKKLSRALRLWSPLKDVDLDFIPANVYESKLSKLMIAE